MKLVNNSRLGPGPQKVMTTQNERKPLKAGPESAREMPVIYNSTPNKIGSSATQHIGMKRPSRMQERIDSKYIAGSNVRSKTILRARTEVRRTSPFKSFLCARTTSRDSEQRFTCPAIVSMLITRFGSRWVAECQPQLKSERVFRPYEAC